MEKELICSAMIFDLDGTLIDSLEDIADAANNTLAAFGMPEHTRDDYRRFVGNGVQVLLERTLPAGHAGPPSARFVETFKQLYRRHLNRKTMPYGGIETVLTRLAENGMKLAVLSNKPDEFTKICIARFFPGIPFTAVYGQREGKPRKPDPRPAREIADKLQVLPANCAFVGDSSVDMATGKGAGMFSIGVSWGFRDCQELMTAGADLIINHPEELLNYAASSR